MENNPASMPNLSEKVVLELYVSGMSQRSMAALRNIKRICETHLPNAYSLEVIDIYKNPEIATARHIVFSPSLIKRLPLPVATLIGDLSDTNKVLRILGINIH
jgi:circadian clock protein KaiB